MAVMVVLTLLPSIAVAGTPGLAQDDPVPRDEEIEEIVVVAPRPVFRIRYEIVKADEALFDKFNALNDDREFNVRCKWQTTGISRLRQHVCQPSFARRINENEWRRNGDELFLSPQLNVPRGELRRKYREFRARMVELAEADPELQELIFKRAHLEREHTAARLRKHLRRDP